MLPCNHVVDRHITVIYLIFMHICCTNVTLTMAYAYISMPAGDLGHILEVQSMGGHSQGCKAAYDDAAESCSELELCKISTFIVSVSLVGSSI